MRQTHQGLHGPRALHFGHCVNRWIHEEFNAATKDKNILKEVDAELERLVNVDDAFVRECALNTIRAGGKRLRPIFVILSAQYFGVKNETLSNLHRSWSWSTQLR